MSCFDLNLVYVKKNLIDETPKHVDFSLVILGCYIAHSSPEDPETQNQIKYFLLALFFPKREVFSK